MANDQPTTGGLELDDTSEFVRSVTFDPVAAAEPKKLILQLPTVAPVMHEDQAIDSMEVDVDEKEDGEAEDEEDEEAMLAAIEGMITAAAGGSAPSEAPAPAEDEIGVRMTIMFCKPFLTFALVSSWALQRNQVAALEWRRRSRSCDSRVS
jgi:hypothetical protein